MTRNPVGDGEGFSTVFWSGMINAFDSEAILNGCQASKGANAWDVDIASGDVKIGSSEPTVSAQTVTLTTPANDSDLDSGEFRVDLVTIDTTGTASVTEGPAASKPIAPDIPTDEVLVCAVLVDGDATGLTSSDIKDYRAVFGHLSNPTAHHTPPSFADETGSFTASDMAGDAVQTITFANTYKNAGWGISVYDSQTGTSADFDGWVTDANGNYTGMNIHHFTGSGNSQTVHWSVFGVTV